MPPATAHESHKDRDRRLARERNERAWQSYDPSDDPYDFAPLSPGDWEGHERDTETPSERRRLEEGTDALGDDSSPRSGDTESSRRIKRQGALAGAGGLATTTAGGTVALVSGKAPASLAAGILGVLGYAVVVNFVQGGWGQVKGWLGAKLLNVPFSPASSSAPSTTLPGQNAASPTAPAGPIAPSAAVYRFPSGQPVAPGSVA